MLEINDDNFEKEVLKSNKPVAIDFWAEWCSPCKTMSPIFEELSKELKEAKFAKLNVDENQELASSFGVMGIPTFLVFNKGKEVGRFVGSMPKSTLKESIKGVI
ncbi:MAG TPA: thioredoxin [Candidatus Nanoarchaeia archaeon]|nr:thioredoxin [Candidatus Nanoarchaeia archaeon]